MKKLKYFFASAIVLVAVAISTIVFAEYKEQKGDLRVGNTISNKNVSVNAGSSNLINDGDVKVVKTVSKTDTEGVYNVKFDISAKEKENKNTTPIYAVVAFDNSGSMICDSAKESYAKSSNNFWGTRKSFTASLGDGETIYCDNSSHDSSVVLKDKWESAVKGTKSFTNEILSIDSSKISYVTFADYASKATQWYKKGDNIPKSVYGHPIGGTNLSDAINKAYNKLSERIIPTNAKKIIIVISDGEPDSVTAATKAANTAKGDGIKIYTIGYSVAKDSTAAAVLNNISSNSANDTTNYSFLAGQDNVSDIFKKLATDITTVYAKNATLTDTIGGNFKFTSSNDNVKVNGQNVSFSIDKLTRQTQSFSFNITIDDENITEDGWYPTNDGFNLTYTDVYGNSQKITSPDDPEVYWVAKRYNYKIEYYYDGQIDNTLTETDKDVKGTEITVSEESIKNNTKTGYKLKNVDPENKMIYISSNEEENIIRVYYVKDETQTKDLSYTVEYYKNGVKVTEDTQTVKDTVQVLKPDTLTVDKSNINTKDKYVGYKFEKTNPTEIPNTIENGSVIKVYYVTDDNQTKDLSYTVEYYKNGVKVTEDTQTVKDTVQVLKPDTLTVDKSNINTKDKYVGYKFEKTNPTEIPNTIENGSVIKVYYVTDDNQTKDLSYTVEYYKDGVKVTEDTQTVKDTVQVLKPNTLKVDKLSINTVNKYVGYKFEKTEPTTIPDTIENGGVIKVYYVTDDNQTKDLYYTVEYYKDGKLVATDTDVEHETKQVLQDNKLTVKNDKINTVDKYVGYKFEKTNPTEIPDTIEHKSIIKVYYVKGTYKYTVNYYYDNVLDKDSTDTFEAKYEDVITTYEQKVKTGYVLDKVTGLDLTISEDESKNVINVYYKKAKYSYVVEYYYDNVLDGTKTDTFKATYNEVIKTYEDKVKTGYVLDKVEGTPLTITEITTNNTIKVYYKKASYTYEVRYYFNRELDESLTEKGTALFGDKITSYTDKVKEDYTLETVENLPLVISEDESKNIINVYYKIDGQGVIEPIEPPHTSANNSIYALILLVNALGASVLLKKREN